MGHHKLKRFAENLTFPNLFQVGFDQLEKEGFALRGRWADHFGNHNPITLELGCGKGDYTVALARIHPERNYIGSTSRVRACGAAPRRPSRSRCPTWPSSAPASSSSTASSVRAR